MTFYAATEKLEKLEKKKDECVAQLRQEMEASQVKVLTCLVDHQEQSSNDIGF
jgi:hypothetical protein